MNQDLTKQQLYESVKKIIEMENDKHLHFNQPKLFTLFSIAFQYMLFCSTKKPGVYIIRTEDSSLADKISKKAKDPSTRKFMASLMIPRKFKSGSSWFYLDFFHMGSWNLTNDIPHEKIQGAIIVKNTSTKILQDIHEDDDLESAGIAVLPENYYRDALVALSPKSITIEMDKTFNNATVVTFPFIKTEAPKISSGVKISQGLNLDSLE